MADAAHAADLEFLAGGGEMAQRIRDHDWSSSPIGPPERWPAELRLTLSLCLQNGFPSYVYWGEALLTFANDAAFRGNPERFGNGLGQPARVVWGDIWEGLGPRLERVFDGQPFAAYDERIVTQRDGAPRESYWNFSAVPIRSATGVILGVFGQAFTTTPHIAAQDALERAKAERDFVFGLAERQRVQRDADDISQLTVEAVAQQLGANRGGFFRVIDEEHLEFGACWTDGLLPAVVGRHPLGNFGAEFIEQSRAGVPLVIPNLHAENGRAQETAELSQAASAISIPLLRRERWEGNLFVSSAAPRDWTRGEVALVEEAAQLCWDAVTRAEAAAELRALNATLADEVRRRTRERDLLWEVSHELLGVADDTGVWQTVSPAWERTLGWSEREIVGRTAEWIVHPDDIEATIACFADVIAGEAVSGFEFRLRARDGSYRMLSWTARLDGGVIVATARDVTEERAREAALERAEERTRLVLAAINGVGIFTLDLATMRYFADGNLARLFGFAPEDTLNGVPLSDVLDRVHPDDLPRLRADMARSHSQRGEGETEYRLSLPDGTVRWILARNHTLSDASGRPETVLGVAVDITDQRQLEDRLRQSQKMEAVGQLTGGLAHDFNNLLTGISGALEMMKLRVTQGRLGELDRYLTTAQGAVTRAAGLTHRLLAFARRQTLDPRPTDVNRLVEGMEELVRRTAGPTVDLQTDLQPQTWATLVDPGQLENALLNLCLNARDAMPHGGRITIRTENIAFDEDAARVREVIPGDYVALSVSDTGTGMTEEVRARAFDPFFTTKPIGEGTGLGLSMIYGFARQSGGVVRIDSVLGEGTTVTIKLPRHHGVAEQAAPAPPAISFETSQSGAVLVVDDEPAVRVLVTDVLTELGYSPVAVGDAEGALAVLQSDAELDLMITDVGLPGSMNGRQLADEARSLRPGLPTIFITGFAETSIFAGRPAEPATALVTKPFTIQYLASRIREVLGQGD